MINPEKNLPKPPESWPASERFINRELSWLAFNTRVLAEAANETNPLLERVKFLAISSNNLDEFYMVRVAGLKDHVRHGVVQLSDDGLTPEQQVQKIHVSATELLHEQQKIWHQLRKQLGSEHVHIIHADALSKEDHAWLETYFLNEVFPALTPIAIDPAHPFPFLPNQGIAQLFQLAHGKNKQQVAIVPLPQKINRFISLPTEKKKSGKEQFRFIRLEDVIELFIETLFPGYEKVSAIVFSVLRDSDLDIEEEAEDLVRQFEHALKQRRRGQVIRIKVGGALTPYLRAFITEHMQVGEQDLIEVEGMIGLASATELYDLALPDLKYTHYTPRFPERINDFAGDCFAAISAKDIVVHHPFESFDVVVQFLRQAAADPDVVSIKQTLYRTSKDSPIVKALVEAAEAGKSVTALVELKARFDEEANLKWARDLERAGAQVVFGFMNLKTHAKVSLVTRRVEGKLKSYVHFGTGNYHPTTAKIYTDLSFFTCDPDLCRDAAYLFNFLTGYAPPKQLSKLVLAPRGLRDKLLELIAAEIEYAKAGRPANVWAKMNALVDPTIIDALYRASQAGVHIELVVRGVCCLRPGVAGLSENIHVKSIVGRFLEHSRIFCFGAGEQLPGPNAKVFISSSDWMPRNFDWRVESLVPLENPTVHAQVMDQIMVANIKDQKNSWVLKSDASYTHVPVTAESFSAHDYFMNNPSLSGRGKALKKIKPTSAMIYKAKKKE